MIIYKVTNLVNGKVYIGQTVNSLAKRKREHIYKAFNKNTGYIFHRALRKYGEENFKWEIIDNTEIQDELNEKEIYWIKFYNSYVCAENPNGYNMTIGGESTTGYKHTEEAKQKVRESQLGRIHTNEEKRKSLETKIKNGTLLKGSKSPNAILTEEDVLKIKQMLKCGESQTEIAKKYKVNVATIGAIKNGVSWSHLGEDISYIEYPKIKRSKLNENQVKEIKLLLKDGKISQREIADDFNVNATTISGIQNGRRWNDIGEDLSYLKQTKITENDVIEIKAFLKEGILSRKEIAKKYNISVGLITSIKTGKSWGHIGEDISYINYSKIQYYKLKEDDVKEIKLLLKDEEITLFEIAKKFNVSKTAISNIKTGKTWSHIGVG